MSDWHESEAKAERMPVLDAKREYMKRDEALSLAVAMEHWRAARRPDRMQP